MRDLLSERIAIVGILEQDWLAVVTGFSDELLGAGRVVRRKRRVHWSRHGCRRFDRLTPLEQARRIAGLAQDKLAKDVVILDMRPVCSYTDYFVIVTGQNPRQTKAIFDEVHEQMKREARCRSSIATGTGRGCR